MVLSLWAPNVVGQPRLFTGTVERARRIRSDLHAHGVYGALGLDVIGVGRFPELRLMQYKRGGFFVIGEWLLDANERSYPQFVEFEEPFKTWLARAARLEIVWSLREEYGELLPDDEVLALDQAELDDRADPVRLEVEDLVRIEVPNQKGRLVSRTVRFNAVIGNSIRIKGCRLSGRPGAASLVLPTSDGLRLRPIQLEPQVKLEIVRRAEALFSPPSPLPPFAVA